MLKHVNNENFKSEVLENKKVTLVDFYADWCGPCKMIAPVLENMANQNDNFDIVKVNVDENGELEQQYGVQSIPTLIVFKDGKEVDKTVGFAGEDGILDLINKHL